MQQFVIGKNEAGQRLDKFLHKYLKEASGSFLYKMLRKKNITLNHQKAQGKERLEEGDCIRFYFSQETFSTFRGQNAGTALEPPQRGKGVDGSEYRKAWHNLKGIEVIYENQDIILLNKPAGMLSQKANPKDISVNEWLIGYLLEKNEISEKQLETFIPSICNRLDRNTSGLVVCGKSLSGSQKMSQLFRERSVHKYYRTFVKGRINQPAQVKGYLAKDGKKNQVIFKERLNREDKEFGEVETRYVPLAYYGNMTYVEVELITGKTHQIRAHMAHLGHPILGDSKYGDKKFNQGLTDFRPRWQLLHACRLEMPVLEGSFEELSKKVFHASEPEYFAQIKRKVREEEVCPPGRPEA